MLFLNTLLLCKETLVEILWRCTFGNQKEKAELGVSRARKITGLYGCTGTRISVLGTVQGEGNRIALQTG